MPGRYFNIIAGGREGQIASVENKQEKAITDKGKVHAFYYDYDMNPICNDGKHLNGLIGKDRLKFIGYYD